MRQVAGGLRLDLAQYRELAAFAQFASDLDKATRDQLTRGEKLTEILKQPQFAPLSVEKQVAIIWTGTNGYLDDVPTPKIRDFEAGLYRFLDQEHADLLPTIASEKSISDASRDALRNAVEAYRRDAGYGTDEKAGADAKAGAEAAAAAAPESEAAPEPSGEAEPVEASHQADEAEEPKEAETA
jgi:F-type H+-transporting ATPase subunit alpha